MVLRRITKRQMAVISQDSKAEWAGIDPQDESRTCQVRGWIFFFFFFKGNEGSQTCSLGHLGTIAKPVLSEHVPALGSLPRLLRLLLPSSSSSTVTAFIKFSKSHGDQ